MSYAYFIVLFLGFILVRYLTAVFVKKMMFLTSNKNITVNPDEDRLNEIKATNKPTFINYDALSISEETAALRELLVNNAYELFRKKYFFGLIASFIYILYAQLIKSLSEEGPLLTEQVTMVYGIAFTYIIYYTGVFYFYRKQFRAIDNKLGFRFELPQITILKKLINWIFNPKYEYFTTYYFLIGFGVIIFLPTEMENGSMLTFPFWAKMVFIIVALTHLGLIYLIKKKSQQVTNIKLLILRVFGDKKQTLMTFGRLSRFWKHFGSWFTIIDPSYLKRANPMFSYKSYLTLIIIIISSWGIPAFIKLIRFPESENEITILNLVLLILALVIYYLIIRYSITRNFAKDEHDIKYKIQKLVNKPRKSDLTFKNLPMYCHDNTWKIAVVEFIKTCNVILMDLRGYSEQRKGCEYEVDLILDSIESKYIVFLVDNENDKDLVKNLIIDRWEYLSINSPNLNLKKPEIKIYNSLDGKEYDIQTTIDLLIEASKS